MLQHIADRIKPPAVTYETPFIQIPGIGTGAAYASGDAFGTGFWVEPVPRAALLRSITFLDLDDEGLAKDVIIFNTEVTTTADNAAFDPSDSDLIGGKARSIVISSGDFTNFTSNQIATVTGIDVPLNLPDGRMWVRLITRGADNIAANNIPWISFGFADVVWD